MLASTGLETNANGVHVNQHGLRINDKGGVNDIGGGVGKEARNREPIFKEFSGVSQAAQARGSTPQVCGAMACGGWQHGGKVSTSVLCERCSIPVSLAWASKSAPGTDGRKIGSLEASP